MRHDTRRAVAGGAEHDPFGRLGLIAVPCAPGSAKVQLQTALFLLPLALAAGAILFVRAVLGFQFPVPWPDETGFVAPAFDFARSGSFFDPGLNPDRVVMWMPPGYMLLLAGVFRLFGYSFAMARWVSTVCGLAALAMAAALAWRLCAGWRRTTAGWALAAAFAAPAMLIDTNIARMEMPFAALLVSEAALAAFGRLYLAAAVIGVAGLLHFNAIYFVPSLLLAVALAAWRRQFGRPGMTDWVAIGASAAAWVAYGVQAATQWRGFREDMAFQFALRRLDSFTDAAHPLWPVLAGTALAMAALATRRCDRAAIIGCFGLSLLVMAHEGHELWYDYGQPLGFACLAVAMLADDALAGRRAAQLRSAAAACAMILVVAMGARITETLRPLLPHRTTLLHSVVAPADIARVRAFIATLPPGATVNFGWTGVELFFLDDLARVGASWSIVRHSVTQGLPLRGVDWRVVCDSTQWPTALFRFDIDFPRRGVDAPCIITKLAQGRQGG